MEDRLEEAIHVLRNHAVGQGPGLEGAHSDMHSLLSSVHNGGLGGLSPAFPNASLALSNRHPAMVSHRHWAECVFVCVAPCHSNMEPSEWIYRHVEYRLFVYHICVQTFLHPEKYS